MPLSEVDLLEFAHDHPEFIPGVKRVLGLTNRDDPFNVPLEPLDWRRGKIQLYAKEGATVESEADIFVVQLPHPAIGIDSSGNRFLARKGDYLIRNHDDAYSLVKRGVTRG